jgi:hypothetical protein
MQLLRYIVPLLLIVLFATEVQATHTAWVATTGSDTTGVGTFSRPWRTLDYVLNVGLPTLGAHEVRVMPGRYDDSVIIYRSFEEEVVVRSHIPHQAVLTNLDGGGTILAVYVAGDANIAIEGFVFNAEGSTGEPCTTRTANMIHFQDASNVRFENNIVYGNNREPYCNDLLKINRSGSPNYPRGIQILNNVFYNPSQVAGNDLIDSVRAGELEIRGNIFFSDLGMNESHSFVMLKRQVVGEDVPPDASSPRYQISENIFLNWEGNPGEAMLTFGGDGVPTYEVSDALVENNLMIGNSGNPIDAPFQFKGVRDITVRSNTVVGDFPGTAYGFLAGTNADNPVVESLRIYNNVFFDPTGTMGSMFLFTFGLTNNATFDLDNNLFWNDGNPLPTGGGVLPGADLNRVEADPGIETDQSAVVLPKWDTTLNQFESGSLTIEEEFARLVDAYGAIPAGSAAVGGSDPANAPAKDIRGWSRDGAPDLGAFEIPPTTGVPAPSIYLLSQNAPNPFNGISRFDFILPADADVSLDLFDLRGRRVRTMIDERLGAGRHDVTLDARGLAVGTYFYRLKVGERVETRRCVVVR